MLNGPQNSRIQGKQKASEKYSCKRSDQDIPEDHDPQRGLGRSDHLQATTKKFPYARNSLLYGILEHHEQLQVGIGKWLSLIACAQLTFLTKHSNI
jgi:hypothetical protein